MSRPHAFVRRLHAQGGELVLMPPIDPIQHPYCDRCKRRHDLADPTDRCGVEFPDGYFVLGLALVCVAVYLLTALR